jgi:sporulation protein YlmC with PRC-barrel domain
MRSSFILAIASASLMSSVAFAQTVEPKSASTPIASTNTTTPSWLTQELAGQWRSSKLIGLNVYNSENDKVGDISELIVDRSGKLEAVVVGVGGFLGIGEHDVAIPYGQISWTFQPVVSSRSSSGPTSTGTASPTRSSESPRSYPDHAVLNMTKDQIKAAPEFKYSR